MENNSTYAPSPAWPTLWPKDAFKFLPTILFLLILGAAFVVGMFVTAIVLILTNPGIIAHPHLSVVDAILGSVLIELPIVVAVWLGLPYIARLSWRALGVKLPSWRDVGIAVLGAIASTIVAAIASGIVDAATHAKHPQDVALMFTSLHQPWQIVLFGFFAVLGGPFAEETFFRLFVFNVGLRYGGFWVGAIVSAVLFGLAHGDLYNLLPLACIGFILCGVYYFSRNAFASMISHGIVNAISLVVFLVNPHAATQ